MERSESAERQQQNRDRSRRGNRPSRFSGGGGGGADKERRHIAKNRVYVSNVPYEYKWNELKDLFRAQVGDVAYVELFNDENDKPRGCGIVEFNSPDSVKKAMEVMHRFALDGRRLVIKEDNGTERDKCGYIIKGGRSEADKREKRSTVDNINFGPVTEQFNTYGLSPQFLESINVTGPLFNRIFVANLDYKVDRAKLKEVFKMAGKVRNIDLSVDKEGNSRGFAIIEYDHPVEAVQAISMFDKQLLFERTMAVRMDRVTVEKEIKLPEGLQGIGPGLGSNGEPLYDVTRYITPNVGLRAPSITGDAAIFNTMPTGIVNSTPLNLQALGLGNLGNLQNQLLQQGVSGDMGMANMNNRMQDICPTFQNGFNGNNMSAFSQSMQANMNRQSIGNDFISQQSGDLMQNNMFGKSMDGSNQNKSMDTVEIQNLPSSISWQLLREKFSEAGQVDFADKTGPFTGIVRFKNPLSASRAIKKFDRTRIDGRTIEVQYC